MYSWTQEHRVEAAESNVLKVINAFLLNGLNDEGPTLNSQCKNCLQSLCKVQQKS